MPKLQARRIRNTARLDGDNKQRDLLSFLPLVGTLVIPFLLIPGLYIFGHATQQGFLGGFGMRSGNFPLDLHETYLRAIDGGQGAMYVEELFADKLWRANLSVISITGVCAGFFLGCLYVLERFVRHRAASINQKKTGRARMVKSEKTVAFVLIRPLIRYLSILAFAGFLLILLVKIALAISDLGEAGGAFIARSELMYYKTIGCHTTTGERWSRCVKVVNGKNEILASGFFIARSPTEIAIYDVDHPVELALPREYRILSAPETPFKPSLPAAAPGEQ